MKFKLSDLWRWDGTVGRGLYALVGVVGLAVKYNLDRFVAEVVFHKPWSPHNYILPGDVFRLGSRDDAMFCLAMLAMASPFVWLGVVLTVRRLRDVDLPCWLAAFFFVPLDRKS